MIQIGERTKLKNTKHKMTGQKERTQTDKTEKAQICDRNKKEQRDTPR